jgi:hypothetical protein
MGNGCSIYLACVVLWMEITIKGALCIQRIFLGFFTIFILEYIHTVVLCMLSLRPKLDFLKRADLSSQRI